MTLSISKMNVLKITLINESFTSWIFIPNKVGIAQNIMKPKAKSKNGLTNQDYRKHAEGLVTSLANGLVGAV